MKANIKYIGAALLMTLSLTGCRDEHLMTGGEGSLSLSATVNSDVEIISRSLSAEEENALAESAVIWISNSKGLIHEFVGASNVPSSIRLVSGHYTAEAWVGDSVPASWDKTFYKSGFVPFDITNGQNTEVALPCRVANTLASVNYTDATLEVLKNPVMTISLEDGITDGSHSLVYEGVTDKKGYFMINSRTKGLRWSLTGEQADGSVFTKEGLIENIKATTEYAINVKYVGSDIAVGGAYFEIEVEEEPVGDETVVDILLPPAYTGLLGFDESGTFRGEQGNIGRKSVFISASTDLKYVEVTSVDFTPVGGADRIGLLNMSETSMATLKAAGIDWAYNYDAEKDLATIRFNLNEEFTNSLTEGEHTFLFTSEDKSGKTSSGTFTIVVTNAPAAPAEVEASTISYTGATLTGTIIKPAAEYGFNLRRVAAGRAYEDWVKIPATVNGSVFTAVVNDLVPGVEYEYTVYADEYTSVETTMFTTRDFQLPNCGFEDWIEVKSPKRGWVISASADDWFWDCGNEGAQSMGKNVTLPDESIKHSGMKSIKLASQFVGIGSIGKFAAGNFFIGDYLKTDGTNGILGWGRPWEHNFYPKALSVWVKYTPAEVDNDSKDYSALKKGDMDKGIIYVAMLDGSTVEDNDYPGWPVIIRTNPKNQRIFDKTAANVIGYGEQVFEGNIGDGASGMVEFIIPIDYTGDVNRIKNIMLVGSASIGGDYFVGGSGSTMWVDDIKLIY